jgi:hypothetical protein
MVESREPSICEQVEALLNAPWEPKKSPHQTKKIDSPSIVPEIPQAQLMVERESTNLRKSELYMVSEAEFIRTFGWWGLD